MTIYARLRKVIVRSVGFRDFNPVKEASHGREKALGKGGRGNRSEVRRDGSAMRGNRGEMRGDRRPGSGQSDRGQMLGNCGQMRGYRSQMRGGISGLK